MKYFLTKSHWWDVDTKSHLQPSSYLQLLHVGKGKNFSFPAWVTQHIHHSLGQAIWPGVVEKHKCTPCFSFIFEITIVSFSSFLPFFQAFLQIPSCWLSNSWSSMLLCMCEFSFWYFYFILFFIVCLSAFVLCGFSWLFRKPWSGVWG